MSWWKMNLGTWFWPKSQSLTFQYTVKFWSVDWKIHLSILCIWDLLNLLNGSRQCHWVLESMVKIDLPLVRSNNQKLPLYSQNPKNDHFALLVIWSSFLWNCDPNCEGKRRLDTRVPLNLHSSKYGCENGLRDAIWRCDRILSGDGLRDSIWNVCWIVCH